MTTRDAAAFLGTSSTMGTVDVGKNADLVLLDANPVDDAAGLHRVCAVVCGGRHYSTADLGHLKDQVRTAHPAT
jgi:imidazolonepropionase-like amidohydrolase